MQSLRNFGDVETYKKIVYPHPEVIETLPTSSAIRDYVKVDYELWGCPVKKVVNKQAGSALMRDLVHALRIIEATAKRLKIPMSKVMVNIDRYGNTSAATIPIAVDEAARRKRIKRQPSQHPSRGAS